MNLSHSDIRSVLTALLAQDAAPPVRQPNDLRAHIPALEGRGLILPAGAIYAGEGWLRNVQMAMDAQPTLFTTPSAGTPAWFSTVVDPKLIEILFAPMRATEVYDEEKMGAWVTTAAEFPTVEPTGYVSSYGDWNNNGNVGTNVNWTPRQSYYYQTIQQYGEREVERYGLARISYVTQLNNAAAFVMNKFQNLSYISGIAGLINYGMINDPNLPAAIQPGLKQAGGYTWVTGGNANATAAEIYLDFLKLFAQLQVQMGGILKQTDRLKVVLSPGRAVYLNTVTAFNITPLATVMMGFPNLEIVQVPEYSTQAGELMQMIAESIDGTETGITAYTEKMRAHPVIPSLSGWQQKKSGGTWGTIIKRPICVASMLGI